ncbi:Kinesin-like protein KIN-14E [Hondaea fermentalgiana]|uniref:Kinesin-like protein KIN-14E n=1 Tax=Hondaea fermentalgiana TaxID=2315210 RepID=A0A2R5GRQ6_9STRA|nr:Kinesin-like protein KIN-14E [Hondaea fermentalgiana]|eukprot:GBG30564.1 Kinesin-like protein KIN-14E [Hondaea fermentalgiana]
MGNSPAKRSSRAVEPGDVTPPEKNQLDIPVQGDHNDATAVEAAEMLGVRVDPDELEREAAAIHDEAVAKAAPPRKPLPSLGSRGLVGSHASLRVEDLIDESAIENQEVDAHEETYVPLTFARERIEQVLLEMRRVKEANLLAFAEAEDCHELMQREMRQQYEDYVDSLKAKSLACIENYKRALDHSQRTITDKEAQFDAAKQALEGRLHDLQLELDSRPAEPPTPEKIHIPVVQVDPRLPIVVSNVEEILTARRADLLAEYLALERTRAQALKDFEAARKAETQTDTQEHGPAVDQGASEKNQNDAAKDSRVVEIDREINDLLRTASENPGPQHTERHELPPQTVEIENAKAESESNKPQVEPSERVRAVPPPNQDSSATEQLEIRASESKRKSDGSVLEDGRQVELENRLVSKIEEQQRKINQLESKLAKLRAKGESENAEAIAKLAPKLRKRQEYVSTLQEQLGVFRNMHSPVDDDHDEAFDGPTVVDIASGHTEAAQMESTGIEKEDHAATHEAQKESLEEAQDKSLADETKSNDHTESIPAAEKSKHEAAKTNDGKEAEGKGEPKTESEIKMDKDDIEPPADLADNNTADAKEETDYVEELQATLSKDKSDDKSSTGAQETDEVGADSATASAASLVSESSTPTKKERKGKKSKSAKAKEGSAEESSSHGASAASLGSEASASSSKEEQKKRKKPNTNENEAQKEAFEDVDVGDQTVPLEESESGDTTTASASKHVNDAKLLKQIKEQEAVIAKLTNELGKRVIKEKEEDVETGAGNAGNQGGAAKRYMEKLKTAEKKLKETEKQAKEAKNKANRLEQELDKLQKQGGGAGGGRAGAGDANSAKLKKELEDLKKKQKKQSEEAEKSHAKAVRTLEAQLKASTEDAARKEQELEAATATVKALQEKASAAEKLEKENESLRKVAEEAEELRKSVESLNQERTELETLYSKEQKLRKEYWNMMEDMKGKIRVFARCRPMAQYELDRNCHQVVSFPDEFTLDVVSNKGPKQFVYDRCFGPDSTQDSIFEDTQNLIQSSLDGYNVCVFAYGQTGSGKTFTMVGSQEHPGIVRRSVTEIFAIREKTKKTHSLVVKLYVLEIYLDNLVDLLYSVLKKADASLVPAQPPRLDIKKDKKGTVFIKGAQMVTVDSTEELLDFFDRANGARKVASTKMNAGSSRSHLVFSLVLENTNLTSKKTSIGKLSLVDLAGSERQDKTGATDERLKEAMSINKSLSALGDVISALSSGESFIPYRNNVLTQLMSDSLGGNAKTLMFVNISPADYNSEETVSSLTYASRVKLIKNNADKSQEDEQLAALKKVVREMTKTGAPPDPEVLKKFDLD